VASLVWPASAAAGRALLRGHTSHRT